MKQLAFIVLLLSLCGCTAKLAYNNLDWVIEWYLDDYIELTDVQSDVFDEKLSVLLSWHQAEELPLYLAQLGELVQDVKEQRMTLSRINYHQETIIQHWQRIKSKVLPEIVDMAPLLTKTQEESLFIALSQRNEEKRARLNKLDEQGKTDKKVERYKKSITRWFGYITENQETLITQRAMSFHLLGERWLNYQEHFQGELKALFAREDRGESFKKNLQTILMNPEVYRDASLEKDRLENAHQYKSLLSEIIRISEAEQRRFFATEVQDYMTDIKDVLVSE